VSWQTIFWTLIPLAINSMAQPGGRICGLPSRYRTYLRCSPFLCAADALSVVSQLAALYLYRKQNFSEAIGTVLQERFEADKGDEHRAGHQLAIHDDDDDEEVETLHSLEAMTWLRWLWFIIGTLPPAIKLMSMSGVPREQAWGMMFLTSWIINESLTIYAATHHTFFTISRGGRISWPGFEQMTISSRYRNFRARVKALQYWLAVAALVVHAVILNSAFRVVFRKWRYSSSLFWSNIPGEIYPPDPLSSTLGIFTVIGKSTCMIGFIAMLFFILRQLRFSRISALAFPILDYCLALINIVINIMRCNWCTYSYKHTPRCEGCNATYSSQYISGFTTAGYVGIFTLVYFLSSWSVRLGKNLLVIFPRGNKNSSKLDHGGFLSLLLFLATILGTILWYGYIYDSDGTVNPSWTGIFG
jgi:hypothetical protein